MVVAWLRLALWRSDLSRPSWLGPRREVANDGSELPPRSPNRSRSIQRGIRGRLAAGWGGGAGEEAGRAFSLRVAVGDAEAHLLQRFGQLAAPGGQAGRSLAEERLRIGEMSRI